MYCNTLLAWQLNVYSNVAFFLVAILVFRKDKKLALLSCLIGIASILWHKYGGTLFYYLDASTIVLLCTYIFLQYKHLVISKKLYMLVFVALILFFAWFFSNAILFYLAVLLPIISLANQYKSHAVNSLFLLFTFSLVLRFIDHVTCEITQIGTHFIWHICNAVIIYFIAITLKSAALPVKIKDIEGPVTSAADLLGKK